MHFSARLSMVALALASSSLARIPQFSQGQAQVYDGNPSNQIYDGQSRIPSLEQQHPITGRSLSPSSSPKAVQIPDGQVQVPMETPSAQAPPPTHSLPPVQTSPPVQAPPSSVQTPSQPAKAPPSPPVVQISDGQLQVPEATHQPALPTVPAPAPAPSGGVVTQISDGQPQAPAASTIASSGPSSSLTASTTLTPSNSPSGSKVVPPAPSSTFVTAAGLQLQPGHGLSQYALAIGLAAWAWGI
ncbi:hypothetical protein N0V93_008164 [Gnomoniopsis smithogilvyi]|uniref:Uncharacterized protein n=1 Tax=Gnomoniopsis smithogilvyi TaxID=1191159 RepID=A0A9W8YMG3_9PEZI|nr:hypothetical protein N0V93_008164 [Gnomoniopsis smithogilvyi]